MHLPIYHRRAGIRGAERYRMFRRMPVFSQDLLYVRLAQDTTIDAETLAWYLCLVRCAGVECLNADQGA